MRLLSHDCRKRKGKGLSLRFLKSKRGWLLAALLAAVLALGGKAWHDTMRDPVVQRTTVTLKGMPTGAKPITIALISDIHVAGPDMPPERLVRIVAQINALQPDAVLIAGDFVSDKGTATHVYRPEEIIAPLAALDTPLGTLAAPGNHDHWYDLPGLKRELGKAGIRLVSNGVVRLGPLVVGILDDAYTGRANLPATLAQMAEYEGARVLLSHSPDPFPDLPPDYGLMLAGHTHCGQIRYPWGGAPATLSDYGERYACGRVDENGNTIVTGAGLGTSLIWVRLFSQPEIWLVTIEPA